MKKIMLTASELRSLHDLLDKREKIQAIKLVRTAVIHKLPTGMSGISLVEAKDSVDEYMARLGMTAIDGSPISHGNSATIVPFRPIKRLVCDFGEGEVELDMDGLSLRVLTSLNGSMRLEDAAALIDLYKIVEGWETSIVNKLMNPGERKA